LETGIFSNIIKIELQDGNTGNFITVTDEDKIKTLIGFFSEKYSKNEYAGNTTGWSYRVKLYDRNNALTADVFIMTSGRIQYKNYFYDTKSNNRIDIDFIKALFLQ
jgi:hypothetical protein